jgi:hypothetical protein
MKDLLFRVFLTVVSIFAASTPTLFFLGARSLLSPEGFLQNFFVFGVGTYFLGVAQILAIIGLILFLLAVWIKI